MKVPQKPPYTGKFDYREILDDLVKNGKFQAFHDFVQNEYYYWDKWKYIAQDWKYDSKKLWFAVKTTRLSHNVLKPFGEDGFAFEIRVPAIIQQYLHEFDINLGGSFQGDNIIPSEERDRYLISSLMEEAIASSQLEGAATSRKVAKEMLENNRKPQNHSEQMILNNYLAMKWIVEHTQESFTLSNLRQLHRILTDKTLTNESDAGSFRQDDEIKVVDTQTGNILHTPPSFEQLDTLMEQFCHFANDKDKTSFFIHPIYKAIILHFLIGYIHPFVDGNGRTARTVFYWYLLKKGYWLIEYLSVSRIILLSKTQYAKAYLHTEFDNNDLTYFSIYNLQCIHRALQDLKKYVHRKNSEKQHVIALLRNTDFNDRQIAIIQDIIQDGTTVFNVQQIENRFNVSNQTARNDLNELVEKNILQTRKSAHKIQFLPVKNYLKKLGIK
jgi:Fic family protein